MFKTYYRNLIRNKVFSLISIVGFSISLAVVLLLISFARGEKQFDRTVPDMDLIYRVLHTQNGAYIVEQATEVLETEFPQVQAATAFCIGSDPVLWNNVNHDIRIVHTDDGFFKVFGTGFLEGIREDVFKDPNQAVITRSCAKKIFGDANPIGEVLNVSHKTDVTVAAIVEDFPEKSSITGEMFCFKDLRIRYSRSGYNGKDYYLYKIFLKLKPGTDPDELEEGFSAAIDPYDMDWLEGEYKLQPFSEVYFDIETQHDDLAHANVKLIRLLGWLALVILILAVFNYVNLTIAQSTNRLSEYGIRQVFGASRLQLAYQFMREAVYQILIALVLSVLLTILIKPALAGILGKDIRVQDILNDPLTILWVLAGLILVAVTAGVYPAISMLRLQPGRMLLKQVARMHGSFDINRLLTVIQFAAMVTLIVSLVTLMRQVKYVRNKDLGYNTELLVRIAVHYKIKDNVPVLLDEISKLASVNSVCASHGTPGAIWNYSSDNGLSVSQISSDQRFIETFRLELLRGRNIRDGEEANVSLINQTLLRELGRWDSVEHTKLFGSEIVGVIGDFHFKNLYEPIGNLQIMNEKDVSHLTVRFNGGDIAQSMKDIKKIFEKNAPGFAFRYEFYDEWLDSMYRQEENRAKSIRLLSAIAILLSCMGLFGMAAFSTGRRTREIGIRKVNGAGTRRILYLLNTDFLKWVAIGIILGIPPGWYFMNRWLTGFAYRTSLDWWIFALAAAVSAAVAILTISWHTWKAASSNPVEALRYE